LEFAPVRIDLLTEITGVGFFPMRGEKESQALSFGVAVNFISLDDPLVTNKQALGRSSDLKEPEAEIQRAHTLQTNELSKTASLVSAILPLNLSILMLDMGFSKL